MKKHNGMRPQDVAILLKIISLKNDNWLNKNLSDQLKISQSEISESLNRCKTARLIDSTKRKVFTNSFKEFIIYGLKYVFPAEPGRIVRGIATAHSAPPINKIISNNNDIYVWNYDFGDIRGQEIEPLYKTIPEVSINDKFFYELLCLVDVFRVGRVREINIAIKEIEKYLK